MRGGAQVGDVADGLVGGDGAGEVAPHQVGPRWAGAGARGPGHSDAERRTRKPGHRDPGFSNSSTADDDSKAVLSILIVERYLPDSRYQSGTESGRFNPALDVSSMPLDNVTSCDSTESIG